MRPHPKGRGSANSWPSSQGCISDQLPLMHDTLHDNQQCYVKTCPYMGKKGLCFWEWPFPETIGDHEDDLEESDSGVNRVRVKVGPNPTLTP